MAVSSTPHRFSVKEAAVFVLLTDSGSSGPTYATTGFKIPGVQSCTISGAATQEQLEGDDVVLAVESTDEALDISIEHGRESFDLMAAIKDWISYTDGANKVLVDVPASGTRYVKIVLRCHKTGDAGGDLLVEIFKFNAANTERSIENKAFGKNSFSGKAIYTESTTDVNGDDYVIRARYTSRETAIPLSLNADSTPPTVTCVPTDAATGVVVSANIVWTASEDLDPNSVNTSSVNVFTATGVPVAGTVTLANDGASTTVTFNPSSNLSASTAYIAMLTTAVRDLAGNPLAAPSLINFTTA